MEWIKSTLGTGNQRSAGDNTSLLADWRSYEQGTTAGNDIEAGPGVTVRSNAAPVASTSQQTLFRSVDGASTKVTGFFKTSLTNLQTGITSSGLPSLETFSIPTGQQLVYFFSFLAAGMLFLMLAFTIFLPTIIISPSKFALSFTLGCMCIMGGFTVLKGWKHQLSHMMGRDRLPFSAAYVGSILSTLYAALIMKSYLLSLLCSGLQVVALLYYSMSYFPGGTTGVKFMLNMFLSAAYSCFGGVQRAVLR